MNFETFKIDIENLLNKRTSFELLEYHFYGYSFGSGILALRIKGGNFLFSFDGRDNILTLSVSKKHEKYPDCIWLELLKQQGLFINEEMALLLSPLKK